MYLASKVSLRGRRKVARVWGGVARKLLIVRVCIYLGLALKLD